jgi:hypothetical protein
VFAAATILALAVAACTPSAAEGPTASAASGSPTSAPVVVTVQTRAELESAFNAREDALAAQDLKAFQATIDLTRPAFRRCQQEEFGVYGRLGVASQHRSIVKAEAYGDAYARGYLSDGASGLVRLYFRKDDGHWILTEPKIAELGGERSKTIAGVRIDYWAVDEDVVPFIGAAAAETRDYVKQYANGALTDPYYVKVIPTRETAGIVACGFSAFANTQTEHAPFIGVWKAWYSADLRAVSDRMRAIFHHEGLHYVQDEFIHRITVRLDWWLIEGWPDYVAKTSSPGTISRALCDAATIPSLKRLIDGVPTEPGTPAELTSQYYGLANSLVEYVYELRGAQGYWDLISLYRDNVDYRVNYPKALGVQPDAFYSGWLVYAKQKHC